MGKKTKTGKGRLDKFYQLAKDQGYRARSAFKLIQLAKKHDFLSKASVCLDLCAAPGGWSQVAQRNMPMGSTIIAIDLCPIKPIHGVTCIQSDITTDKCRSLLKKELLGKRADVVLHDGAPNVGSSWAKDAFGQNELTLHSMKLACEHLRAGGTFVTKVFRSADYNSLMWVFNQLFSKVEATKPTASRNVSAEIFVLCMGFKAGKIDPRFFDSKWVFMETVEPLDDAGAGGGTKRGAVTLNDHIKAQPKRNRSGYEPGDDLKIMAAHDFLAATNPAELLVTHHRVNLDAPGSEALAGHASTTPEIRELCGDLKVLGKGDLSVLLKWRMRIVREREKVERQARKAEQAAASGDAAKAAKAAAAAPADAAAALARDVDAAVAELLDDGARPKAAAADEGEDSAAEIEADDKLEHELAEQVEKRRREERRDAKKTMARQKKQEWRKKMSLHSAKNSSADMPELFRLSNKSQDALENQDDYIDPATLDSDREESSADEAAESDSDSDEGLDRLAKLEVDIAVGQQLRKMQHDDKHRTKMQRVQKKKKETRRQRVMAAWAGEMNEFSAAIQDKAAGEKADREKDSDAEEDDDSEDDLQALRKLQGAPGSTFGGAIDGAALEALANGPERGSEDEGEASAAEELQDGAEAPPDGTSSTAIVPKPDEEDLRAEHRMARWFSQDIFQSVGGSSSSKSNKLIPLDRDSEAESSDGEGGAIRELDDSKLPKMPLTDKQKRSLKRKKEEERKDKRGKKHKDDDADAEDKGPLEVAPLEAPRPLVSRSGHTLKPSDPQELAETMALGSVLVDSKKARMDIIDAAYNRYAFEDDPLLPDWFTEDEKRYNKPELPISKELMAQFRAKLREINARPIRKVAEARARKKKRLQKRLEKLRSTAMSLADTPDMSEAAKAKHMRKAMRTMAKQEERKVQVVAIKKGGGGKSMLKGKVPKGAKLKVVDKRMKSDLRGERKAAKRNKSKTKAINTKKAKKQQSKKGRKG